MKRERKIYGPSFKIKAVQLSKETCNKKLVLKEKAKNKSFQFYFSSKQPYGSPRIAIELNSLGVKIQIHGGKIFEGVGPEKQIKQEI